MSLDLLEGKKVDFLLPIRSQYMALHDFTKNVYDVFKRCGANCRLITPEEYFLVPVNDPPDMTFGLNGTPFNENRQMLCDIIERPHFAYLIDPPYRFYEILSTPYVYVGSDDRYGCRFLEGVEFFRSCFFPHGVDQNLSFDSSKKRTVDVLMLATFIDHERLREEWKEYLPKIVCQVMDEAIEHTLCDDHTSFIEAFSLSYQERLGLDKEPERVGQDFILPLILLERFVKGKERTDLIKSIRDADVVLLNGHAEGQPGWEKVLGDDYPNITLRESVTYSEGLELMKQAKIVLNSFSKNKEGGHDRIFNGLACGALVLTNENIFMKESFSDEENILFFKHSELELVNDKLVKYLSDESIRQEVVAKGREEVMAHHTWDCRVEALSFVWKELLSS